MTLVEKILAAHARKNEVSPGDTITVTVDLVLANDITGALAIKEFQRQGHTKVFDPRKVMMVPDHFVPNKDIPSAEQAKLVREFAYQHGLVYFEVGEMGIEHVILPEKGLALPGQVIMGADSHTCTYGALGAFASGVGSSDIASVMASGQIEVTVPETLRFVYRGKRGKWVAGKDLILHTISDIDVDGALNCAMEFGGETVDEISMDGRFTMANMAIEAGADTGIFRVDQKTLDYVKPRARDPYTVYEPDENAQYSRVIEYDISALEPQVALPGSPANAKPISQIGDIRIDQVVIGSCTNSRLEDLEIAAQVLKGKCVDKKIRCIVIPGSQRIYLEALHQGLIETFLEAGAAVSTPTCGPCLGGHMGVLADGERCLATTNRNFVGRMGSRQSEVYLCNPAVAAASAISGRIISPEEVLS